MASDIDICNLALARLGDPAALYNLSDSTAQARLCSRFYSVARDSLLEMHPWKFATRRATLVATTNSGTEWDYTYTLPTDFVTALAVLPADATDDYQVAGTPVTRPYALESTGTATVLRTDEVDADLRYVAKITTTTLYPSLFVETLSWQLASALAGPILKGDAGAAEAKRCQAMVKLYLDQAMRHDANQVSNSMTHTPGWMGVR